MTYLRKLCGFAAVFAAIFVFGALFAACDGAVNGGETDDGGDTEQPGGEGGNGSATYYTVTFNLNGGGGTASEGKKVASGAVITLPAQGDMTTPGGKTFDGWTLDGQNYAPESAYTVKADAEFAASWAAITYTITYNLNGGNGTAPEAQTVSYGESVTIADDSGFSRPGTGFNGWNTKEDGSGMKINQGSTYTPSASITLYAVWMSECTVSYDLNGGGGTLPAQETVPSRGGTPRQAAGH